MTNTNFFLLGFENNKVIHTIASVEVCVCGRGGGKGRRGELDSPNQEARSLPRRVIRSVSKSNVSLGTQGGERGVDHPASSSHAEN